MQAGGNVTITATGGGRDSNILIRGSELDAGKNVNLSADNNVMLEAAANTHEQSWRGSVLRILRNSTGAFDWYPGAYTDFFDLCRGE